VLPDGSIKHFHDLPHFFMDKAGNNDIVGAIMDITEHQVAEEGIRRSEAYLAEAQRVSHTGSFGWNVSTDEHLWSDETFRIFEFAPASKLSLQMILDRVHPKDMPSVNMAIAAGNRAEGIDLEFRILMPDGRIKYLHVAGKAERRATGSIEVIGAVMDITERKLVEEGFRQSEERLRLVLDSIGAHVMVTTSEGELDFVNQPSLDYFGKTLEELKRWLTSNVIIHPDERASAIAVWRRSVETGVSYDVDNRFRRSDGVYRWFHVRGRPQRDAQGSIVRWYALLTDIDERKKAEQKLEAQEIELRQILDFAPQLVAVYGPNRERLHINRIALDYLGVSLEEWRQTPDQSVFVHPDDRARERDYFDRALPSGSSYELELRLRKGDGSYRWFLARSNPVRDDKGTITRWYVAWTDIEDRKRAEERLQQENVALREEIDKASMFEEIVGTSPALQTVLSSISKVAPSDSTVLVTGETGTGKELVARAIHRRSLRASRAFVSVNCAAVPRDLIASELFGHEKGAFTGAMQRRVGRFELAEGGTIFLDEVGELLPDTQVALLRVLQEREVERIGGSRPIHVNVRVIAATNRDLEAAVASGTFRQDLYYRLNVFPLDVPPLRERREDISLLVEYFIDRYARKAGKNIRTIDKKTLQLLQSYPWPGNIRELQNVIERSVIVSETENFSVDERWLSQQPRDRRSGGKLHLSQKLAATEKEIIEEALRESQGRIFGPLGAAAKLGIARSTLESKIQSLNINKKRFKRQPGT
jgi:formate hydrogenlyase transcriptional activator